ncbi:hypothetical protein [Streptomyces zinciresistens]|nr:hypothetical protein [Streptomyces zinciresistens]
MKRNVLHVPETGWTKARHHRSPAIRTCVPAVADRSRRTPSRAGADDHIVRGDD